MIASCYTGAWDYAFGNFDDYMLPFYEKALVDGHTEEELTELLAGFFMKTNEICGRCAHNYARSRFRALLPTNMSISVAKPLIVFPVYA